MLNVLHRECPIDRSWNCRSCRAFVWTVRQASPSSNVNAMRGEAAGLCHEGQAHSPIASPGCTGAPSADSSSPAKGTASCKAHHCSAKRRVFVGHCDSMPSAGGTAHPRCLHRRSPWGCCLLAGWNLPLVHRGGSHPLAHSSPPAWQPEVCSLLDSLKLRVQVSPY